MLSWLDSAVRDALRSIASRVVGEQGPPPPTAAVTPAVGAHEEIAQAPASPEPSAAFDRVPDDVADHETVVRRCNVDHVKVDKKSGKRSVKYQAFIATKAPFEISVDRDGYCEPWAKIATESKRTLAQLSVKMVRTQVTRAKIVAAKPPPEHAHVESHVSVGGPKQYETKEAAMRDLENWDAHIAVCTELAKLSIPLVRPITTTT